MSSKLIYRDVAVGAAEDAAVTVSGATAKSAPGKLPEGVSTPPLAMPERNFWLLDGARQVYTTQAVALLSSAVSGADCTFSTPPVIRVDFDESYTTLGITLRFSPETLDWCSDVTITWYQGTTQLMQKDFAPTGPEYFCEQTVAAFNRVDIALNATSMPYRRARVEQVVFGVIREFAAAELGSVSIKQEADPISAKVPASYLDWQLKSDSGTEYVFQRKQPVEAYHNDKLLGVFYVDEIPERTGEGDYSVECQDAIGVLDNYEWPGKMYNTATAFSSVVADILGGAFEADISAALAAQTVKGYIPAGTAREALQQAAFAVGAVVDTSGTDKIKFFAPSYTDPTDIPDRDVYTGGSVKQSAVVTSVVVTYHTYAQGSGTSGDDVVTVGGTKYVHTTGTVTVSNPNVTASDKKNVKTVTDATLVNADNAQAVAQRVYNYWARRSTVSAKIVWEDRGIMEYVTVPTSWGKDMTGSIISAKITLSNLTAANVEVLV